MTNDTPLDMQTIHKKQLEDAELLASVAKYPDRYFTKTLSEQESTVCHRRECVEIHQSAGNI